MLVYHPRGKSSIYLFLISSEATIAVIGTHMTIAILPIRADDISVTT